MLRGRCVRFLAAWMTLVCLGNMLPAPRVGALNAAATPLTAMARALSPVGNGRSGAVYLAQGAPRPAYGARGEARCGNCLTALELAIPVLAALGLAAFALARCHRLRKENLALQRINASQTEFLARVSHEIRTPLGAMIGLSRIAAEQAADPAAVRDCVQKIDSCAGHLLSLVNDVLDLSKINKGKLTLCERAFDLRQMLTLVREIALPDAREAGLSLEFHLDPQLGTYAVGDELKLRQVLINLLSNAVKYNRRGGRVDLRVMRVQPRQGAEQVYFCVEDTGIGVEAAFARHIFDDYAREGRASADGVGLGLNIAWHLVKLMGGELRLESEVGRGSRFFFTIALPMAAALPDDAENCAPSASLKDKTLLIVEDNPTNLYIVQTMALGMGARVITAENGAQGLQCYLASEEFEISAILMDVRMPVMDGYEAARRIRSAGRQDAPSVPILALSANAFDGDARRSLEAGMNAHLVKPLNAEALRRALLAHTAPGMQDRA